jgi:hypothetical protein
MHLRKAGVMTELCQSNCTVQQVILTSQKRSEWVFKTSINCCQLQA